MYNTLNSAFTDALKREGKVITAYSDNTPYNVIFKRNSDTNQLQDKLTIFYPVSEGIHAGQLLTYGNKHFLTLNQESPENEIYFKSDLIETNATLHAITNGAEINVPVYAYDITNGLTQNNNVISLVSGDIHIIAEPSLIQSLAIDSTFDAVGRHWKIDNIISKDNVKHLYCEVTQTTHTYTVTITGNDAYHRGESAQLTATAKEDSTIINNASFVWTSSDTSLATVDNTGLVQFVGDGNVTITATWTTQNVSGTKQIAITEPDSYSLSITANDTYTTADTPTLTAIAQKNGTTDSTATITWTSSDTTVAIIDSTGKVTFLIAGSVTFTATWTEQNITATKTVTVTQAQNMTCTITSPSAATIKVGMSKTLTAHFWKGSTEQTGITPVWTVVPPTGYESNITYTTSGMTITLTAANKTAMIGQYINVTLADSNHTCSATLQVKIVSLI